MAQNKQPVGLFADSVDYSAQTQILAARGNVRIVSDNQVLLAHTVVFNEKTGKLTVPGGFTITDGKGNVLTAENAELSSDLRNNVIKGARILIANQFQMAADQVQYKDKRFKILDRVVASTCRICKSAPIPFWQIRSNRVIHDEQEKQIYFENARLEVIGVPIFYAPKLRLPDPTVERASGFLVPEFLTSQVLNFGVKIPYYIVIDDHSDATITAYGATVGSFITEGQYRRQTKNGYYEFDGALLLLDGIDNDAFRSSVAGEGEFEFGTDYKWGFTLDLASDRFFREQYSFDGTSSAIVASDRLFSSLYLERNRINSFFTVNASYIQSLRANEIDQEIPLVLPDIYYRSISQDTLLGGKFGFTAHSTTLLRENSNRYFRTGIEAEWQREWRLGNGMLFSARGEVNGEQYILNNNTGFSGNSASRFTPIVSTEIRWPWSKAHGSITHIIEPVVQLVWSDRTQNVTPNEDGILVDFDETNLFSTNRFPGFDQNELGFRTNVGLNYAFYTASGWDFSTTAGRVFRENDLGQFSTGSGLEGASSDWLSAFSLRYQNRFEARNRFLFDRDFAVSKNEASLIFNYDAFQLETTYLRLAPNLAAGVSNRRSEGFVELEYSPYGNWTYSASWRHDFTIDSATEGQFGIKYANECIEIDLTLSLQYATSSNIDTNEQLGLKVSLLGLGSQANKARKRHNCAF